jgi:uncharacterized protein
LVDYRADDLGILRPDGLGRTVMAKKRPLTAADVLRRYVDEDLPEFIGLTLTDVNAVGLFGDRPIHVAAIRGDIDELVALLDAGAEIDAAGEHGYTALHEAVSQNHADVVKCLLRRGASRVLKNKWGDTAADLARMHKREDMFELLT